MISILYLINTPEERKSEEVAALVMITDSVLEILGGIAFLFMMVRTLVLR